MKWVRSRACNEVVAGSWAAALRACSCRSRVTAAGCGGVPASRLLTRGMKWVRSRACNEVVAGSWAAALRACSCRSRVTAAGCGGVPASRLLTRGMKWVRSRACNEVVAGSWAAALRACSCRSRVTGCELRGGLRRRSRVAVADAGHEMGPIKGLQRGCCWELGGGSSSLLVQKSGHGCGLRRRSRVAVADAGMKWVRSRACNEVVAGSWAAALRACSCRSRVTAAGCGGVPASRLLTRGMKWVRSRACNEVVAGSWRRLFEPRSC